MDFDLQRQRVRPHLLERRTAAPQGDLSPGQYHAVVANPPYIAPKDQGLTDRDRRRFTSCYGHYSLGVPFISCSFNWQSVDRAEASGYGG